MTLLFTVGEVSRCHGDQNEHDDLEQVAQVDSRLLRPRHEDMGDVKKDDEHRRVKALFKTIPEAHQNNRYEKKLTIQDMVGYMRSHGAVVQHRYYGDHQKNDNPAGFLGL